MSVERFTQNLKPRKLNFIFHNFLNIEYNLLMFSVIKLPQLKNIIIINRSIYINEVEIKTRQKTPTHFKYRYKN